MKLPRKAAWKWNFTALAFCIPFGGMLILMLINQYSPFSGRYAMLYSDMYHQYYPFFAAFRRTLRSGGSLVYNWSIGIGVDYLGLIAYYLASPLNLLSVLMPESWVLGYFSMLMPIKLGLAGLFYAIFLKKLFGKEDFAVSLFASFYALCAWALGYQWNVMWLDTFALLPLVALGTISLIRDKKFLLYTVTLWLSVYSNYYIGLFTCFFVALLFFCVELCAWPGWKRFFADLCRIALFSILAIGMTAVLSYSSVMGLQSTQSSVNKFPQGFKLNMADENSIIGLFGAMRAAAGNMGGAIEPTFKEGLPNLYCGVGTVLFGFLFLMSDDVKLRERLCALGLLLFFLLSFIIRQLDYIWHGFHFPNMIPYRFSFLYSFVLLTMAYRAWNLRRKFDLLQILSAIFLTAAVLACSEDVLATIDIPLGSMEFKLYKYLTYNGIFLILYSAALIYGLLRKKADPEDPDSMLAARFFRIQHRRRSRTACLVLAALEITATLSCFGFYFPGTGISNYPRGTKEAASMFRYMHEREEDKDFSRAEVTHTQTLNDDALNGYNGITAFTSSANVHITEFLRQLGYGAKNTYNRYAFEESSPVANLFLNLKYMLEREGKDRTSSMFEEVHHFGRVSLLKNTAYLPLGFLTEPEIADLDFMANTDVFQFQNELFSAATGMDGEVWSRITGNNLEIIGNNATVDSKNDSGYCTYSNTDNASNVTFYYAADRAGFACIWLDLPKRNDFYVNLNENELYKESISLPQMLAVGDVEPGDIISVRVICAEGENSTMNVKAGILDNELFFRGYEHLAENPMEIIRFRDTRVDAYVDTEWDGLLYTSIPQNGNWKAFVDNEETPITLVGDCMIALPITAGEHMIRFEYHNAAFSLGWKISLGSAAVFLVLTKVAYFPRKKEQTA